MNPRHGVEAVDGLIERVRALLRRRFDGSPLQVQDRGQERHVVGDAMLQLLEQHGGAFALVREIIDRLVEAVDDIHQQRRRCCVHREDHSTPAIKREGLSRHKLIVPAYETTHRGDGSTRARSPKKRSKNNCREDGDEGHRVERSTRQGPRQECPDQNRACRNLAVPSMMAQLPAGSDQTHANTLTPPATGRLASTRSAILSAVRCS